MRSPFSRSINSRRTPARSRSNSGSIARRLTRFLKGRSPRCPARRIFARHARGRACSDRAGRARRGTRLPQHRTGGCLGWRPPNRAVLRLAVFELLHTDAPGPVVVGRGDRTGPSLWQRRPRPRFVAGHSRARSSTGRTAMASPQTTPPADASSTDQRLSMALFGFGTQAHEPTHPQADPAETQSTGDDSTAEPAVARSGPWPARPPAGRTLPRPRGCSTPTSATSSSVRGGWLTRSFWRSFVRHAHGSTDMGPAAAEGIVVDVRRAAAGPRGRSRNRDSIRSARQLLVQARADRGRRWPWPRSAAPR